MLHNDPAQEGQTFYPPQYSPDAEPFLIMIPKDVFDSILDVAYETTQSVEETILAKLETFLATPLFITLDTKSLDFIYYPTGKSVAQAIGPVKSVRLEVMR
jgi:hypothetical protein